MYKLEGNGIVSWLKRVVTHNKLGKISKYLILFLGFLKYPRKNGFFFGSKKVIYLKNDFPLKE